MNGNNGSSTRLLLPTCAVASGLFGVAIIRYSMGLFFVALGRQTDVLPGIVRLAWGIHDWRWLILLVGTGGLVYGCRRAQSQEQVQVISALYMLAWFVLCFFVQFCLAYGLNRR